MTQTAARSPANLRPTAPEFVPAFVRLSTLNPDASEFKPRQLPIAQVTETAASVQAATEMTAPAVITTESVAAIASEPTPCTRAHELDSVAKDASSQRSPRSFTLSPILPIETVPDVLDMFAPDVEMIGQGGFGIVFKAVPLCAAAPAPVALKLMSKQPRDGESDADVKIRLDGMRAEARLLRVLAHPNIVPAQRVLEDAACVAVQMPLARCDASAHLLKGARPQPEREVRRVLYDATRGLSAVHAAGFAHGDLKSENIVILAEPAATAALIDFGSAYHAAFSYADSSARGVPERASEFHGTTRMVPPEWILNDAGLGQALDMWALGVVAVEGLRGAAGLDTAPALALREAQGAPPLDLDDVFDCGVLAAQQARMIALHGTDVVLGIASELASDEAKDFVARLLQQDPEHRLTAAEALAHPWFDALRANDAAVSGVSEKETVALSPLTEPSPNSPAPSLLSVSSPLESATPEFEEACDCSSCFALPCMAALSANAHARTLDERTLPQDDETPTRPASPWARSGGVGVARHERPLSSGQTRIPRLGTCCATASPIASEAGSFATATSTPNEQPQHERDHERPHHRQQRRRQKRRPADKMSCTPSYMRPTQSSLARARALACGDEYLR